MLVKRYLKSLVYLAPWLAAVLLLVLPSTQLAHALPKGVLEGVQEEVRVPPCSIDAVISSDRTTETGVPLERSSVTVQYSIYASPILEPISGDFEWAVLRPDELSDAPSGSVRIENLQKGEARTGSFTFTAPTAGKLTLQLAYTRDDARTVENAPASCKGVFDLNIATRFVVSLESIHIHDTLSRLEDSDNVYFEASFSGQGQRSTGKYIGDLSGGDHQLLLPLGPFEWVPGDELTELQINTIILNKGFAGSDAEKFAQFKNSIDGAVAGGFGVEGYKDGVSVFLTNQLLMPDCDGPVFVEARTFSTSLLNAETQANGGIFTETIESVFPRKGACNVNGSRYDAHYWFFRNATIYRVKVTTANVDDAGTYSHVYLRLIGENGTSREVHLDDYKENWHRGTTEEFLIASNDLGRITAVEVRLDNQSDDNSWVLEKVSVEDVYNSGKSWLFPVEHGGIWMDVDPGLSDRGPRVRLDALGARPF